VFSLVNKEGLKGSKKRNVKPDRVTVELLGGLFAQAAQTNHKTKSRDGAENENEELHDFLLPAHRVARFRAVDVWLCGC